MVSKRGQSLLEFILILSVLTSIGLVLFYTIHPGGAIGTAQFNAADKISKD